MKRTVIILIPCLIVLGILLFTMYNPKKIQFEGIWELSSNPDGCFTRVRFMDDIPNDKKGIIVDETEGNHTQVWFGFYTAKGKKIAVDLKEPAAEPFTMIGSKNDNQLQLQYSWKGKDYSCSYVPE